MKRTTMADIESGSGGETCEMDEDNSFYKRYHLSDPFSVLLPSSEEMEELFDVKQPSLSSTNITDSVCSYSTIGSNGYDFKLNEDENEAIEVSMRNDSAIVVDDLIVNEEAPNSEPEDMQDISKMNKSVRSQSDILKTLFVSNDKYCKTNSLYDNINEPIGIDYCKMFASTPKCSLSLNRNISMSLQDVSTIETFPLESKTNNAFSTETIQSQSMSSTTKSKDSGFQRSASCLSLSSGNRSYVHIQSKVKQYIKDIKEAEANRKKQLKINTCGETLKSCKENDVVVNTLETDSEPKEMVKIISVLKNEIKEKDTILNELQQNYNSLLGRYAEAINQIDLLRLRSSLNYDYSDLHSDGNSYSNLNTSAICFDCSKREINRPVSNNTNNSNDIVLHKKSGVSFQTIPIIESPSSNDTSTHVDMSLHSTSGLQRGSKNNVNINVIGVSNERESLSIDENKNLCVNSPVCEETGDKTESLKDVCVTETQQSQSGSHSTAWLNSFDSVKSVTLRPISRMYSSSSRLDKKMAPLPLPPPSLTNTSVFKFNNSKNCKANRPQIIVHNNVDINDQYRNDISNQKNKRHKFVNDNEESSEPDNITLTGSGNDLDVPYLNCQSISKLELPKVDPFDKVKRWQASLPTIGLVRSHSSSSFDSLELLEDSRTHLYRHSSLDSKLDNNKIYNYRSFNSQPQKVKPDRLKCSSNDDKDASSCLITKSEQKLPSTLKYHDICGDVCGKNAQLNNGVHNNLNKSRHSNNRLLRSDAFDVSNQVEHRDNSPDRAVMDDKKVDSLPFIAAGCEKDDPLSIVDDSSSMSSSILSSLKDYDKFNGNIKNVTKTSSFSNKNINEREIKNFSSSNHFMNKTNVDLICKSDEGLDKELGSSKKRVGFSLSAHFKVRSSEGESQDGCSFKKIFAWDSPKREENNNSTSKTLTKNVSLQDLKVTERSKSSNIQENKRRREKLREYTEILSNRRSLDVNASKSLINVGTQVPDELSKSSACKPKEHKEPVKARSYNENLEDAGECLRYVIMEIERLHHQLQTCLLQKGCT